MKYYKFEKIFLKSRNSFKLDAITESTFFNIKTNYISSNRVDV